MNKRIVTISFAFLIFIKSWADEGMWLPLLLGQQVYGDMAKKGLKLTKEQLYSINKSSLKDAIIIFGGGCTGEIVSNQGLIFTNHHCGYDAIASASTVEHNYLRDGFYAASHAEEIPTGLSVQFLLRIDDVTKQVMDSLKGLSGADRVKKQTQVLSLINKSMSDESKNITTRISPLFKGNQFLAFVYQVYKFIRLVGAPPESVGKFGGDTDNWEWPRHTGDFSVFRVYADANNQPAAYAENNKPLTPKWSLPVSIKPLKDGDYAMIWGYPGGTNRYESSYGIKLATDTKNPTLVELRDVRLKYMFEEMKKDPAIKLKLASSYAGIANYWKFFDGETKQLLKYDVYGQKVKAEQSFQSWANGKPEYESIFSNWKSAYDQWIPFEKHRVYMIEGIMGSSLAQMASTYMDIESMLKTGDSKSATALKSLVSRTEEAKADQDITSDKNIMAAVTKMFYNNVAKDQQPTAYFAKIEKTYGSLTDDATYKKMADDIFSKTMFLNDAGLKAFAEKPSVDALVNDPAYEYVNSFYKNYSQRYLPLYQKFTAANQENGRLYLKGIMEKDPAKAKMMYPDATFTMRVSYGQVKSYKPRDAVQYDYVTTSKGLLEKYKPGDYEFDLPSRQIDLIKKKDFGQYVDPIRKDLVIGFITTNDITGGNSGSPVLNGKGELIGLAFDGNYEALSHKLAFDKDLNRTICVDIRYVLWCIDKLGGASNLIKELKIMK